MEDSPLNYLSSSLDEQFQYVEDLQAEQIPIQPDQNHQQIEDYSAEVDSNSLNTTPKTLLVEVFNDPNYINEASVPKKLKLSKVLSKIMEKYQEEEKQERMKQAERVSNGKEMEEKPSKLQCQDGKARQQSSYLSIVSNSRKIKKEQYPTKNMLPSFKTPFISYLSTFFPKEVFESFPIIRRIRQKFGINLQDYEDLFKVQAFRPYLRTYFRNKMIYRDLFMSRIEYRTKRIYFKKLYIFEEAFHNGVFKAIN